MESIGKAIRDMMGNKKLLEASFSLNPKEWAERQSESVNEIQGDLNEIDGYECSLCRNKGYISFTQEIKKGDSITYDEVIRECTCMPIRRSIRRMKKSGLEGSITRCTFDKYEATEDWQQHIKSKAIAFVENVEKPVDNTSNKWFFIGGAIGCGKTHLCTAIVRELLLKGKEAVYMLWVDESIKIKAVVNDAQKYESLIDPIKKAEVLYIDDFFKIVRGQSGDELKPTAADIKLAYEILNYRYQQSGLITIISSERYVSEIEEIDSAIGSRLYEKAKEYTCNVKRIRERNYRIKDMMI